MSEPRRWRISWATQRAVGPRLDVAPREDVEVVAVEDLLSDETLRRVAASIEDREGTYVSPEIAQAALRAALGDDA